LNARLSYGVGTGHINAPAHAIMDSTKLRQRFHAAPVVAAALLLVVGTTTPAADLAYSPAPIDNPLKGFLAATSSRGGSFPHSLEFRHFKWSFLQKSKTEIDWSLLDQWLQAVAGRGHQAVFRVHTDWPGQRSSVPAFLLDAGARHFVVTNSFWNRQPGDVLLDFNDPHFIRVMTNFVAALGARFDGDPRIGFVQAGLLGSWGEWRAWDFPPAIRQSFAPGPAVQAAILDAYQRAFRSTKVQMRFPDERNAEAPVGYHDDWFAREGIEAAFKAAGPRSREKWRTQPIGGRFHPHYRDCLWDGLNACDLGPHAVFLEIESSHASYLVLPGAFREIQPEAVNYARMWAQRLGYELHVARAAFQTAAANHLRVQVSVTNRGVAPFYYRWPMILAACAGAELKARWATDWDLTRIIPGEAMSEFETSLPVKNLPRGRYELLLGVPNPVPTGMPLRFANESQDMTLDGWVTLGRLELR
jgi:hypothetical protein